MGIRNRAFETARTQYQGHAGFREKVQLGAAESVCVLYGTADRVCSGEKGDREIRGVLPAAGQRNQNGNSGSSLIPDLAPDRIPFRSARRASDAVLQQCACFIPLSDRCDCRGTSCGGTRRPLQSHRRRRCQQHHAGNREASDGVRPAGRHPDSRTHLPRTG